MRIFCAATAVVAASPGQGWYARAPKSTRSTSDSMTRNCGCARRRCARSRSSSITVKAPRRSAKGWVSAARPGPISTTCWPGTGAMAFTMASMMAPSDKKCWPKRLRAMCCIRTGAAWRGANRSFSAARGFRRRRGCAHRAPRPQRLLRCAGRAVPRAGGRALGRG